MSKVKGYETGPRKRLLEFLKAHCDEQFSAAAIAERISDAEGAGISLSSVYRNIDKLVQEGSVRRFEGEDGKKSLYQYIGGECSEHLHLKCTECGRIIHVDERTTEALLHTALDSSDFSIDEKKTLLFGVCGECKE